ncbi:hypothetical protein QVD17_06238 [Tagetes erecta]|uniref:Auxin response factor domain-containing protein n=1 Tax=Tagetes erecta TaxID=13708 RepID=A0AAD8LK89_TARER|nr:hypothetical protein QVD17_06238 [Tagetes erecta]
MAYCLPFWSLAEFVSALVTDLKASREVPKLTAYTKNSGRPVPGHRRMFPVKRNVFTTSLKDISNRYDITLTSKQQMQVIFLRRLGITEQLLSFGLPAKIICKVMNVQLLQSEVTIADPTLLEPPSCTVRSFCNKLSEFDATAHKGLCFLHKQALLDMSQHRPKLKNCKISLGMRFKMTFEDEGFAERRFAGTVVGVEDYDWKSIKVEWDELPSPLLLPEKVSCWELECCKRTMLTSCLAKFKNLFGWACS